MTKTLLLLTCASGALSMSAGAAVAATATASAAANTGATNVTELVVTAEKREQSLQKVPVAVAVFTGKERDTIGINTVQDVTNFAPGFTYDPATVHAYIRGVGRQSVNITDDQRVANYEDEFYVYSPYGLDKSSLFLSQEQIERGPQNVGGRNAVGGSIDEISVRPTDTPYAEVRGIVGNYDTYGVEAAVSGQVAPGLDLRLAGYDHNQDTGWFKNLAGGPSEGNVSHEWYVEGQMDWKPNDKAEFWARTFFSGWNNRGDAGSRVGFNRGSWDETNLTDGNLPGYVAAGLFVNPNYGYADPTINPVAAGLSKDDPVVPGSTVLANKNIFNNPVLGDVYDFAALIPRTVKLNGYDDLNYIFTYHFPGFDFKYTGGVQGYNYSLNYAATDTNVRSFTLAGPFGGLPINGAINENYEEDDWWTMHDLTFESTTDSPLQWTAGGMYYFQHYNQPYQVTDPGQPQLTHPLVGLGALVPACLGPAAAAACFAAPNPLNFIYAQDYNFYVQSEGVYGQMSYKFNDMFKLTGDLRWSSDHKWGIEAMRSTLFSSGIIDALAPLLGPFTPSVDFTQSLACPTGTPNTVANPTGCTTGPLAKGVTSIATVQPNGFIERSLGDSSGALTGGGGIEFTPTNDIFTYFRYSRGYASLSYEAGPVGANPEVAPEFLNSYELGYKESFGKSLLVDIAAFYYDYVNLQVPITILNGPTTLASFVNVPKSVSEGVELEAYWSPVRDLVVTGTYSYDYTSILTGCTGTGVGAAFTPAPGALCLVDTNDPAAVAAGSRPVNGSVLQTVRGDPLPNAPLNKVGVDVAYTWHFGDLGSLTFSGDYVFRSSQNGDVFNHFYDKAPSWYDVDFRGLWAGPGDKYEIIAYVKNVFNTLQYDVGGEGSGLLGSATGTTTNASGLFESGNYEIAPPRTFGMEFRYKFF
jgi:iron complex outermembrane receptor protein